MKLNKKGLWLDYIPTAAVAVLIITFAILREQSFIKTLPTLVTLIVQLLLVRANRSAFLIGGINTLLYGVSFYCEALYFSLFKAIAITAPIQFFSYFRWKKKSVDGTHCIRVLSMPMRITIALGIVVSWLLCFKLLGAVISSGRFIEADSLVFVIGVAVPILSAFGYADSQYLNIAACIISLVMWIAITIEEPENINFVLISVYNLFRVCEAAVTWTRLSPKKAEQNFEYKGESYEKNSI